MITKEKFKEIWDASSLPKYFTMMDNLEKIGFKFRDDKFGDMNDYQSLALNEWLDKNNLNLDTVTIEQISEVKDEIFKRAEVLKDASAEARQ
jgi:hypothetical protein